MLRKQTKPASEDSLIQLFKTRYSAHSPTLKRGIGDDAAILQPSGAEELWAITSDMLVEAIDFRRNWISARMLGRKAVAVNLSDLAAMGAQPRFFTVSLAVTPDISEKWILEFQDGLQERGASEGALLIGGDLSGARETIAVSVTAIGESRKRKVVYRSGGKPGDLLYVTGRLGRAAAGLRLLQDDGSKRGRLQKEAFMAHCDPEPRCRAGLWLAQCGMVSCMMDLSDGLSADLPRLCGASGCGAEVRLQDLPVFPGSSSWGCDPVELALHGGEDYELLFAVRKAKAGFFEKAYPRALPPVTRIGTLTSETGSIWILGQIWGKRVPMPRRGWDHFRVNRGRPTRSPI